MTDKVQFQTNIPVEVALKYGNGKDVTGQYGDQVLYTLTDGRVMYVPPIVRKQIEDLDVARGELFTITKAEKKNGTRRTIEWQVAVHRRSAIGTDGRPPARDESNVGRRSASARATGDPRRDHAADRSNSLSSTGQLLKQALASAVDAAAEAERYAGTHGIALQFTSEDIREIGLRIHAGAGPMKRPV
ncbi:MAG TPA: hypothetical protein VKX49_10025 [Bryobacteraceae bacterium]|nr:hypothetical protein [Bryobacteraceae bacterium]